MTLSNPKIDLQQYSCLFFDLDDTLYPRDNGVWELIRQRIELFMTEEMRFSDEEVRELRNRLWKQYGTTLRGLQTEYNVDMAHYLTFVHNVPIAEALDPDPVLEQSLTALSIRKFIFTNSDHTHARRVTDRLGVTHCFDGVVDITAMAPYCKPQPEAFEVALAACGEPPERCVLIDDSIRNLETAQALGMKTISIGEHALNGSPHIDTIHELFSLF